MHTQRLKTRDSEEAIQKARRQVDEGQCRVTEVQNEWRSVGRLLRMSHGAAWRMQQTRRGFLDHILGCKLVTFLCRYLKLGFHVRMQNLSIFTSLEKKKFEIYCRDILLHEHIVVLYGISNFNAVH